MSEVSLCIAMVGDEENMGKQAHLIRAIRKNEMKIARLQLALEIERNRQRIVNIQQKLARHR